MDEIEAEWPSLVADVNRHSEPLARGRADLLCNCDGVVGAELDSFRRSGAEACRHPSRDQLG